MTAQDPKKLFLIDAYAIIYRAYYALVRSPRITADGRNTSAIFGFCNALHDILRKENPQYMAVCFDPAGGHTFRHEEYPEYKAGRDKQPEDITVSIPYIKDIVRAYGIRVVEVERYEADDVIGTLAGRAWPECGLTTYMMTPDKDYGQLVDDHVLMYRPALGGQGFEIRGPQQVCERYGIASPRQVIDLLALEGDTSDNIPGCPGVGPKTAQKLIAEFGDVENLIAHTAGLKGALKQKIEDNTAQILFSKRLATIKTDVPLDFGIADLKRKDPDTGALRNIFTDLEFKSFINRLNENAGGLQTAPPPAAQPDNPAMGSLFDAADAPQPSPSAAAVFDPMASAMTVADTPATLARMCALASQATGVAIAVCADGEDAMTATMRGMAVSTAARVNFFVPMADGNPDPAVTDMLAPLLQNPAVTVVSHDVKRDMILLRRMGIELTAPYFDTALAHYLLKPEMSHHPADVAMAYAGIALPEYAMSALQRKRPVPQADLPVRLCALADAARQLRQPLAGALEKDGTLALYNDIELPMVRVLARMQWTGVRIDTDDLDRMSRQMTRRMLDLEAQCHRIAGHPFNTGSPSQVGEVLFGQLQLMPNAKRTKTGQYSTTEEILEKLRHAHPIVQLILEIRTLRKLLSTYIDALPRMVNPQTGRIHTTFNQTVTATGRISSTNPNLQNIPIRTEVGREIRRAFVADPGCVMLSADYSQIELRLMACLSADPAMRAAFVEGQDIHRATAAKIYGTDPAGVTDNQRRNAKTANFGIIYGISAFGLSERLGIPRAEAKQLIDGYLATYPGVRTYMDDMIDFARKNGYVQTVMGRKRWLPEINSRNAVVRGYAERNAVNAPLQGSAADIIKRAMIDIDRRFEQLGLRARMLIQVHDELVFNVPADEVDTVLQIVTRSMQQAWPEAAVPLTVGIGTGTDWLQAH